MSGHTEIRVCGAARVWDSLDQLREVALARGCTPAQFENAVETIVSDPQHVASYLQRHKFADGLSKGTLKAA
jgi:hypothetical protein